MFLRGFWFVGFYSVLAYVSAPISVQACALYKYVDSHCVCAVSFLLLRILSSKTLKYTHKYIYTTTLLPPASVQGVLAGENHSCDVSALGVPVHCAPRHRCSPRCRLLFFCFLTLVLAFDRRKYFFRTNASFF